MSAGISAGTIASIGASLAGSAIGGAVSGAMSPGTSGGGANYYTPTGLGAADTTWQNLLNQQYATQWGLNQNVNQQALNSYQQQLAAAQQYSPAYQQAANAAGQGYGNLANTLNTQSGLNFGTQQDLLGAGRNVYQTALDPQSALYNRTVQQLQDQTGATNSMYGLGSSAAGAGLANQAMSNFNIDWQNQQLQRQLAGLQGYAGAAGTAGQYGQLATGQAQAAPGYQLQAGQLPYQIAQQIAGQPGQIANTYAQSLEQGPLASGAALTGQIIPYLNYGAGAQSVPFQSQAAGAGALGSQISQGISGLGSNPQVQSALGSLFGGGATGSFGGGDFSGAFTSNPYYSGGGNQYGFTM